MTGEKQSDAQRLIGSWRHVGSTVNGQPRPGQPGDNGDLVRRYELNGDRLVLRAPNSTLEVTWERIK